MKLKWGDGSWGGGMSAPKLPGFGTAFDIARMGGGLTEATNMSACPQSQ